MNSLPNLAEAQMTDLSKITALAAELNKQSNQVNQILEDFEAKMQPLNLGLEVWLWEYPLRKNDETKTINVEDILGFGKGPDNKAVLLVKTVKYEQDQSGDPDRAHPITGYPMWEKLGESKPQLLSKASRELRIESLPKLDHIVKLLVKKVEEPEKV